MLYAGERQDVPIVTHGPFVGETRADLLRVSHAYAMAACRGSVNSGGSDGHLAIAALLGDVMSQTASTLLLRNLHDVFGEIDSVRRRAAIDEIFHEDAVFYEPNGHLSRP